MEDLPLALRRGRRDAGQQQQQQQQQDHSRRTRSSSSRAAKTIPTTPSRGPNKRVRFSDLGAASTGLTPSLRRATLLTPGSSSSSPSSATKRRRRLSTSDAENNNNNNTPTQITFLPLRQVIDGRVKRRIRRNGLSEEMNMVTAEKRRRAQQAKAEVDALRAELAAKDAQIRRLSGVTVVVDSDELEDADSDAETEIEDGRQARALPPADQGESIDDLKRQVEALRNALKSPAPSSRASSGGGGGGGGDVHIVGWGGRDGAGEYYHSDMDLDHHLDDSDDEDGFGDSTIADLVCSTPSRRPANMRHSFLTPPSTGSPPPRLGTPNSDQHHQHHRQHTPPSMVHAGVQAQLSDCEKRELGDELTSLHLEIDKLTSMLETYEAVTSRLSDKLAPFSSSGGSNSPSHGAGGGSGSGSAAEAILASRSPAVRVEAQLNHLLQTFAARSAALADIDASLHQLGFPGAHPTEILASLSSSFREARLELEYLTPGELALPLTAAGAAVLDTLLARLRELTRQAEEDQDVLGEYQHLEQSLRRQLGTRVEAMDELRAEAATLRDKVKLRNMRIRELEAGVDRLRGAVATSTRDVGDLEALARRLEADLDAARKALGQRDDDVAALEDQLAHARAHATALQAQMTQLAEDQDRDASRSAEREAALRRDVAEANEALRAARATIDKLAADKEWLGQRLGKDKARARAAVEAMKAELERAVRMSEDLLASPKSPGREDDDDDNHCQSGFSF